MTAFAVGTLDASSKPPVRRNLWAGDGLFGDRPLGTVTEKVWSQLTEVLCMQVFTFFLFFTLDGLLLALHHLPCHFLRSFSDVFDVLHGFCCEHVSP